MSNPTIRDITSRDYYNGEEPGTNENTMKAEQAEYVTTGYPGPGFPAAAACRPAFPRISRNDAIYQKGNVKCQ